MKRLSSFLIVIFLITIVSVFGQEWSGSQFNKRRERANLSFSDIYGDYFLFSSQETVSLDLEEAQLVDVLKMFSRKTGLNFISTEAVRERNLTAYLKEVPLKEAMDILFEANNLAYEFYPEANIFVVKDLGKPVSELKTKVYHLKYARLGSSRMTSEISDLLEGAGTKVGIKKAIKSIVGDDQGEVIGYSDSNTLVVRASPSLFPAIDQVINDLDVPPLKVMIEVEVLDVAKGAVEELGFRHSGGIHGSLTPWPDPSDYEEKGEDVEEAEKSMSFHPGHIGGFSRTAVVDLSSYSISAEFERVDTTAKTLARPSILTLNNETAKIDITTDEVVGTKRDEDEETGRITTEAERKDTGVSLRVTPQVNPSTGEITLVVNPSVDDAVASAFVDHLGNKFLNIRKRQTRSVVRLNDGETLLLGGLIIEVNNDTLIKVPFLGDIPLLGALFRYKSVNLSERELLVFITPKIIQNNRFVKKKSGVSLLKREQYHPSRQESVKGVLDKYTVSYKD